MEEKKTLLTYAGLTKLEDELHDLKVNKRKEVADKMGISQSYISRLEKRIIEKMRQDIEQLVKIA